MSTGVAASLLGASVGGAMARAVRVGAQPLSSPMVAVSIGRIGDLSPFDLSTVDPGFTQDVADTLGNLGTPDDGMEQLFTDMAMSIDSDSAGLAGTISGLDDITDVDFDRFQSAVFDPIATATGDVAAAGDTLLNVFNSDLLPPTNPPAPGPPGPPPPPGPGGGIGGGAPCCTLADISCCPPTCPPEGCTPII